ncbi:MAG TPA: tail fiber domain-containing protein [Thermoanaerobaculia bacterium]|nr:tail fiber domain-containing protein [Thermoanaerobaculia bacterium]
MPSVSPLREGFQPFVLLAALFLCASTAQAQGFNNLYLGTGAGNPGVSTGNHNTALGETSLSSNTSGSLNTAVGSDACFSNTEGDSNTAVGAFALFANTTGDVNTAVGSGTMPSNTTGSANTAAGVGALNFNTTGGSNTAVGFQALFGNTVGSNNTAFGSNALANSSGSGNIALGRSAGGNIIGGSNNIHIGNPAPGNESNTIRIGNSQTAAYLAGVNGVTLSTGTEVFVDSSGRLGTLTSSLRFKEDVRDMGEASQNLMKLRPVSFLYKAGFDDGSRTPQYGLIAEEVAKIYPDLVQYDDQGKPFTVRYHVINAMLLNELQKQHGIVEEQREQVGKLSTRLEEQEARLKQLEALLSARSEAPEAP